MMRCQSDYRVILRLICLLAILMGYGMQSVSAQLPGARTSAGLVSWYDFSESEGNIIHDRSGSAVPLDLQIEQPESVEWRGQSLLVRNEVKIWSVDAAAGLMDRIISANAFSIELWLRTTDVSQQGPARVVSLSKNPSERNLTLGQDADRWDLRLRTTSRDRNGIPSTSTGAKAVSDQLTHLLMTRDSEGNLQIYVNGILEAGGSVPGQLQNWDRSVPLILANERTGDRPWLGELHLLAIYDRALGAREVSQHFAAGAEPPADVWTAEVIKPQQMSPFEKHIAPLLATHCLECHDPAIRRGGLDLSSEMGVAGGGDSGAAIVAGDPAGSTLWERVLSDEMPHDRAPLPTADKELLKQWITDGAKWSLPVIDPVLYVHGGGEPQVWVQRLTVDEYISTVLAATGVDISVEARELLPPDFRADGFSNTAYSLSVDFQHVEAWSRLAAIITERMDIPAFAGRFSGQRSLSTDATMRKQVRAMGKWLLRGPLDDQEEISFSGIATTVASTGGDYEQAVRYTVEAMLQSPRFVYRMERQRGDGEPRRPDSWELASRLSYMIQGGPPDAELTAAADKGELGSTEQISAQIDRLLQDDRARDRSVQFISQWLNLNRLASMRPAAEKFPGWSSQLAAAMREETERFFEDLVWEQRKPLSDLLNAQFSWLTPELAAHYGLKSAGDGWQRYDLRDVSERGGLLTQGSVLTMGGDDASMVSRGLFVLHDLLRGTINAPPPCVNTTAPPLREGLTQRAIAEGRIADQKCGVCHTRFEPLAFGLEKYDGVGAHSDVDRFGNSLREDGELLFPGTARPVSFQNSRQLMELLAESDRVQQSLTWKLVQFTLGRPVGIREARQIEGIHASAVAEGGSYQALMKAILLSDLVLLGRTEMAEE